MASKPNFGADQPGADQPGADQPGADRPGAGAAAADDPAFQAWLDAEWELGPDPAPAPTSPISPAPTLPIAPAPAPTQCLLHYNLVTQRAVRLQPGSSASASASSSSPPPRPLHWSQRLESSGAKRRRLMATVPLEERTMGYEAIVDAVILQGTRVDEEDRRLQRIWEARWNNGEGPDGPGTTPKVREWRRQWEAQQEARRLVDLALQMPFGADEPGADELEAADHTGASSRADAGTHDKGKGEVKDKGTGNGE